MKKFLLLFVILALGPTWAPALHAASPLDQFSVALLGHMETVIETTTRGRTNAELLATPFQVGKWDGSYIAGLDGGVLGDIHPVSIGDAGFNWTAGLHVHLSPFIRRVLPQIAPNYPALAALEINPRVSYLFRNRTNGVKAGWQVGLGIGWSFGLSPQS